ncbi:hypothetical protein G6F51_013070 [Rhizopus arrhizus]|uniref:Core-binding (CB) domain-containing protein n=1 Tax=Rhizopus oryzae TaxID=64495 RepID=A0A9P7C2Q9_RHIOR|nr:hypothetical protein G6F51_013070 [Rhizopus arrhizus]
MPTGCTISTYTGGREYEGRSAQQTDKHTIIRGKCVSTCIPKNQQTNGAVEDRCVRSTPQQTATEVLELTSRSGSDESRCIQPTMAEEGNVFVPTMEVHTTGYTKNQEGKDQTSSASNAILDNATLVPHGEQPEAEESADIFQTEEMVDDRMALISKAREIWGLTLDNAKYLNKSTRNSTQKTYDSAWRKWTSWCRQQDPKIDATSYNVKNVIEFLMANKELSSQTLNGMRSAIASVWKVLHPKETPLADQEFIRSFFEAKRKQEVRIPTQQQLMTWDTNILLKNIKKKWPNNEDLELYDLQKKAILLLSLATMARPGSDIGRLQKRDVIFEMKNEHITGATIHFRLL